MAEAEGFFFRGTTYGWPGNPSPRKERKTCATTDPFVATLFAIECLQHGPSHVLIAPRNAFEGPSGPPNHAAIFECEVVVNVPPIEFASRSILVIDAQQSRDILVSMGFGRLPVRIAGKSGLRDSVNQSYADSDRLSEYQIREFTAKVQEALT